MEALKNQFSIKYFSLNWKRILMRFFIYLLGVYFFGLGIALYLNTNVGVSQIDLTQFAFLAVLQKIILDGDQKGQVPNEITSKYYPTYLLVFYVCMLIMVWIIRFINTYHKYKEFRDNRIIINALISSLLELIPCFTWSYSISLSLLYLRDYNNWISWQIEMIRIGFYLLAFYIYCLGVALTVYANMLFAPYNGLSTELHILTKWKYQYCRILIDFLLALIGVLLILFQNWAWDLKMMFFNNYGGFGTIFMVFISGPIIGYLINKLKVSSAHKLLY